MMSMTPSQMRQKSIAQADALRHHRYGQVDRERTRDAHSEPPTSPEITAAGKRVNRATAKEDKDIGPFDRSPNASIRF